MLEISVPELYNAPLEKKVILRVDLLEVLRPIIGDNCYIYRDYLYNVVAGKGDVMLMFSHMYRRHKALLMYVNDMATYGDNLVPLVDRCLEPLRDKVNSYHDEVNQRLTDVGAKYLVTTHCYEYFCFRDEASIPEVKGGTIIC